MARIRPFKPMLFADHVGDGAERLDSVLQAPRMAGDRSKYVRFARCAARLAEWSRSGDIVTGQEQIMRAGDALVALVEVADITGPDEVKPSAYDDAARLLEATNCQLRLQACQVSGDPAWLNDPSLISDRVVTVIGDPAPWAATREFAGGRISHARSQVLALLVSGPSEPEACAASRLVGWSLREFSA